MTPEEIRNIFNEELDRRRGEDLTHKAHHAFVEAMVRREERRLEVWQNIKVHVLGWGIVAIIGGLGTWALNHLSK